REQSPGCHHCDDCLEDMAQHTLEVCLAWAEQRRALEDTAAGDLSLPTIFQTIVRSESAWNTAACFCEKLMSAKEAAERDRERTSTLPSLRRRTGCRRARNDLRPPRVVGPRVLN
ncbi:jg14141, partial [Pararge aegeria aegeria]